MLEFHWNGQRSAVCGDGIHFFLPKRLNLFSLSFSLSFSRLPGLDSLVIVTLAGRVWARLEAGVLWVVGDTSILSEEIADVMAWIHVFISSFKKPQRHKTVTSSTPLWLPRWCGEGTEQPHLIPSGCAPPQTPPEAEQPWPTHHPHIDAHQLSAAASPHGTAAQAAQ